MLGQLGMQKLTRAGTGEFVLAPDRVRGLVTGLGGKDSIRSRGRESGCRLTFKLRECRFPAGWMRAAKLYTV